jgi:peptidoglycan hydrolase-like protein with peptidoglycan-binding domain
MKSFAIALLTTAALTAPALAQTTNNPGSAVPTSQQSQTQKTPPMNPGQDQSGMNNQAGNDQAPIAPQQLSRREIRQVQGALKKDGFSSGRVDGRWGPETTDAVRKFQQNKGIEANGQLDGQTVADLGLNTAKFEQRGNTNAPSTNRGANPSNTGSSVQH